MNGYTNIEGYTVIYSYEDDTLTFLLDTISKTKQFTLNSQGMTLPIETPYVIGYDFNSHNYYVFFVSQMPDIHIFDTPLLASIASTSVYGYIRYDSSTEFSAITGMSFYGKEIDQFYSLNKGYEMEIRSDFKSGSIMSVPYEKTADFFEFHLEKESITCTFGVETRVTNGTNKPMSVNSRLLLQFSEAKSSDKLIKLFGITRDFFSFIAYRKNIDILNANLYGKTKYNSFGRIGTLYYNFGQCDMEEDKEIKKIIPYEFVKPHIQDIFQLISNDKLYVEHIPESSYNRQHITAARFVLITAAFEWTVRSAYDIEISDKQKQVKADILEAIQKIPDQKSYNKKFMKKFQFYEHLISGVDINLSGKIVYALKDLDPILKPFIDNLYKLNGKETDPYTKMGDRLQAQRNNYAHGNIDKELNPDVILDIIVLEWVNYSMVFKTIGYTNNQISRLINGIFHLNFDIPDEENLCNKKEGENDKEISIEHNLKNQKENINFVEKIKNMVKVFVKLLNSFS